MDIQLKNRLKSFGWRLGVVVAVAILNQISLNLTTFGFSGPSVVFISLILAEITKYLNTVEDNQIISQ